MDTRAIFVRWRVAMREPERLLDDLAEWTSINTVIVAHTFSSCDRGEVLVLPSALDVDGLPVPGVDPDDLEAMFRFVEMARARGFQVSLNLGPTNPLIPGDPPAGCLDVTGRHVVEPWVWGCPNNPWIVSHGEALVQEMVSTWPTFDMLDLNHLEYPHFCKKGYTELFVCFCDWCRRRADDAGLDFEGMRREAAAAYEYLSAPGPAGADRLPEVSANTVLRYVAQKPGLADWLGFRMSSMSNFIRSVAAAAREAAQRHKPDLRIGMSAQLASVSPLVGTDFVGLSAIFDWQAPKFPDYIPGVILPRVARDVASTSGRWSEVELMPVMRELLGLGPGPNEYIPAEPSHEEQVYSNAFDTSIIDRQMEHLGAVKGRLPLFPWIWFHYQDPEDLRQKVDAVEAHGFDGYFIWCWGQNLTTEALKAATGVL